MAGWLLAMQRCRAAAVELAPQVAGLVTRAAALYAFVGWTALIVLVPERWLERLERRSPRRE